MLQENLKEINQELPEGVILVAVSKTKPAKAVQELYDAGQRIFGENRVQELVDKYGVLPKDIQWHQIGHLQKNKVKYIASFVSMIEAVDSLELIEIIQKEAVKNNRTIEVLLQVKIAQEETKFGLEIEELKEILSLYSSGQFPNVTIKGFMGMASFVEDENQVREEFISLRDIFEEYKKEYKLDILSMGMSGDYMLAIECGSNMVRVGTKLFGQRDYTI